MCRYSTGSTCWKQDHSRGTGISSTHLGQRGILAGHMFSVLDDTQLLVQVVGGAARQVICLDWPIRYMMAIQESPG